MRSPPSTRHIGAVGRKGVSEIAAWAIGPDPDQPVGIGYGQRPQQDGIDHTENRGVAADTEGQRDGRQRGHARAADEHALAESNVVEQVAVIEYGSQGFDPRIRILSRTGKRGCITSLQYIAAQILVLHDVRQLLADIAGVHLDRLFLQVGSLERDFFQKFFHNGVQTPRADILR